MFRAIERMIAAFEAGTLSRRELVTRLGVLVGSVAGLERLGRGAEAEKRGGATFEAVGLNHIALRVTNVARSRDFYKKHLAMEVMHEDANSCFMRCGAHWIALFRGDEPRMDHYCYSIDGYDPDAGVAKLEKAGLAPRREANRVYFPDPDGLTVQIAAPD